jgi:hypothetical protein
MGTYSVEVRLADASRRQCTDLIAAVDDRFAVTPGDGYRRPPHLLLYGPFETDNIAGVVHAVERVCAEFDIVPYEIAGLGHHRDQAIYAAVAPTPQLRDLRRKLASALLAISRTDVPQRDRADVYRFSIPIATDIGDLFPEVWAYCSDSKIYHKEYALRVTIRDGNDIVREYDLLLDESLSPEAAVDEGRFATTQEVLTKRRSSDDHVGLMTNDPPAHRQRARREWYRRRERFRERVHTAIDDTRTFIDDQLPPAAPSVAQTSSRDAGSVAQRASAHANAFSKRVRARLTALRDRRDD